MSKLRFISLLFLLFYAKLHIYQSILINTVEVGRKYLGKSFVACEQENPFTMLRKYNRSLLELTTPSGYLTLALNRTYNWLI